MSKLLSNIGVNGYLPRLNESVPVQETEVQDFDIISIGFASGLHEVAIFDAKDSKAVKEVPLLEL